MKLPENLLEELWNKFYVDPMKKSGIPPIPKTLEFMLKDAFIGGIHVTLMEVPNYLPESGDMNEEMALMSKLHDEIIEFKNNRSTTMKDLHEELKKSNL